MSHRAESEIKISENQPTLIWDGGCDFCRRWVERWRAVTGDSIHFVKSQDLGDAFPNVSREALTRTVVLVEPDGRILAGAAAVFRALSVRRSRSWLWWSYRHVPLFGAISEMAYRLVASTRHLLSPIARLLCGKQIGRATYFDARRWFLRGLGMVYLIAFVSLWSQVDGLIGSDGILPIGPLLPAVRERIGAHAFAILPTLCWLDASNNFLHLLCASGAGLSVLLILGIAPALSLAGLFICYLSLATAGQTFLAFQWDILLLETGFLAIFVTPWRLWPNELLIWNRARDHAAPDPIPSVGVFLLKFLLFKLMFMSGVVKLTSGDDSWLKLTALDYHYWSQPLPTVFAWWANQSPEWFKKASVAFCLFVELVVPFFIWAPRRLRLAAAGLLVFLQIGIAITGNYCFFNLLTILLCLFLIDDGVLGRDTRQSGSEPSFFPSRRFCGRIVRGLAWVVLLMTLPLNAWHIYSAFNPASEMPRRLRSLAEKVGPFRVAEGYGLFRVMTKDRKEIEIEGSSDGIEWKPYEFRWKPDDPMRAPRWCAPHQPRLDWQMWFAALGSARQNEWFVSLAVCLLENRRDVIGLFANDPFPGGPHYVRARFFRYRFTDSSERRGSGAWWKREELGEYLPTISVEQLQPR